MLSDEVVTPEVPQVPIEGVVETPQQQALTEAEIASLQTMSDAEKLKFIQEKGILSKPQDVAIQLFNNLYPKVANSRHKMSNAGWVRVTDALIQGEVYNMARMTDFEKRMAMAISKLVESRLIMEAQVIQEQHEEFKKSNNEKKEENGHTNQEA